MLNMNEFLKYLRKGLANQRGKKKEDACEKVLGYNGVVNKWANFYEEEQDNIFIFIASTLERFQATKTYSVEEMAVYRLAITEIPLFMSSCMAERDRKNQEQIEKIQKHVVETRQLPTQ